MYISIYVYIYICINVSMYICIYIYVSCINVYMYVYMHICRYSVGTGPKNSELMHLGDQLADEMLTKTGRRMAESTSCRGRRLSVAWPAQVQSECLSPRRQAWLLPQLFRCCFALFYLLDRPTFQSKFRWSTVKPVLYAFLELSQGFDAKAFIGQ